jgi:adenylosuccinate synthase
LFDETGDELRKIGSEFGATTGRPRRCGWIDLVALKFSCMINGVTQIVMTKADVLDSFKELKVCTSYSINGELTREIPFQLAKINAEPVYDNFKGWYDTPSIKVDNGQALPVNMQDYINYINSYTGAPVKYISNGPEREQIIVL